MKKTFKIFGYGIISLIIIVYGIFLMVLPFTVNLNKYKPEIQKIVKDNTDLNIDFGKIKLFTTPLLEIGVKTSNIKLKNPSDNSIVFKTDKIHGKIFLPALLWSNIQITGFSVDNPYLNLEIIEGKKFKIAQTYENLINKKRQQKLKQNVLNEKQKTSFLPENMKINITGVNIKNYKALVNDLKTSHKLILKGDSLKLAYFNGNRAKLKTEAEFYSDKNKNITAKLDIDTFLPKYEFQEIETDNEDIYEMPFINPVYIYRDYNLKSNINSKIKIRKSQKDNKIKINGFLNIEDTTVSLAGLELPKSYFKLNSRGTKSSIESKLFVTKTEFINLIANIDYGKKRFADIILKSTKVHLDNLLNIARAYLDSIHIKNDLNNVKAKGYFLSNAKLKTNFEDIDSCGRIIFRNGNITDKNIGLLLDGIYANIFFDNSSIEVGNSKILVGNKPLNFSGKISANSMANFEIKGEHLPIIGLYNAFAPKDLKRKFKLNNGYLTINSKLFGDIKEVTIYAKTDLEKLNISTTNGYFNLKNDLLHLGYANNSGTIVGKLKNEGLLLNIPKKYSQLNINKFIANIDNNSINIPAAFIKFNRNSSFNLKGKIDKKYTEFNFNMDGFLSSRDIAHFLGETIVPYFDIKGFIPIKSTITGNLKNFQFITQAKTNSANYLTPVKFTQINNKDTITQIFLEKNGNTLRLKNTGLFLLNGNKSVLKGWNPNIIRGKKILDVKLTISNLTTNPFISLLRVNIKDTLNGSLHIFPKSNISLEGNLSGFGDIFNPNINGKIILKEINIPEIETRIKNIIIKPNANGFVANVSQITANNSDFDAIISSSWSNISKLVIDKFNLSSKFIDVNRITKVSDKIISQIPKLQPYGNKIYSPAKNIPFTINSGSINFKEIKLDDIILNNTVGNIFLKNDVLRISNIKTYPMGGNITGSVNANLIDMRVHARLWGKNFNIEKVLFDSLKMKDTLTGKLNFNADLSFKGTELNQQLKTLNGKIDFNVKNGQLGPFGKLENFIMAENIRENAFFSSAVGSIITNLVTFDTSRFNSLYGHIGIINGIAEIIPIKSQGNAMSMYISGNANLLTNIANLRVRGKLASAFSDKLGILSNINPINLVKHTPGLNATAVKAFALFCEEISEKEMNALPALGENKTDENATKFQIILKGDTRKPLKMIKSFKWLVVNSEMQAARNFVDTIPTPIEGEENLNIEELIKHREEQANIEHYQQQPSKELNVKQSKKKKIKD